MSVSRQMIFARRKLRRGIFLFLIVLSIPLGVLVNRVYTQLRLENFVQYRAAAEELVSRINIRIGELVALEEGRPFDEYKFFSVAKNTLYRDILVGVSPLSKLPVESPFMGAVGYFELSPAGELSSPILPNDVVADGANISSSERVARRKILDELKTILFVQKNHDGPGEGKLLPDAEKAWNQQESVYLGQQLAQLNLDDRFYRAGGNERMKGESLAGLYYNQDEQRQRASRKEALNVVSQAKGIESDKSVKQLKADTINEVGRLGSESSFQVSAVEGEIDPLQVSLLPSGHFAFYRKVWRGGQRYIQGVVVDAAQFIRTVIAEPFEGSWLSKRLTMIVGVYGQVFQVVGAKPAQRISYGSSSRLSFYSYEGPEKNNDILVYRTAINSPMNKVELVFTSPDLPLGARATIVDTLIIVLLLVILLGLAFLYRLGVAQIALAEQQGNFVSAVSHELKTPLTSIRMYGEMLRSNLVVDEAKRRSYYDYIFHESERLSRLIANVLQMARLSRDSERIELALLSTETLFDILRSRVASMVEGAGFALVIELPDELRKLSFKGNEDALVQIFINLVDNAIKFSRAASRKEIVVGCRSGAGKTIEFFVRDFGPGIDRRKQKQLFQLFYRGESELTRSTPGTGIGLALVRELSLRMGGNVSVVNENPGAEFRVRFPSA